jgi:cytochrome c oxidase subunit 2
MNKQKLEIYFMIAVLVILVGSAVANYGTINEISESISHDPTSTNVTGGTVIHVIGHQWAWTFVYENNTSTVNAFTVTVNERVTLLVNSTDVIHDLYIPQMDVQSYAVPGQTNEIQFTPTQTGTFFFECVEYCGEYHYEMRGYMTVVS